HFMYQEVPFLDRFKAAAADGFRAVEICFAYDVGLDAVLQALAETGQDLISFNFPAGEFRMGEVRGLAGHPDKQDEFDAQMREGLAWARATGAPRAIAPLAGMIPTDIDAATCLETYICNIARWVPELEMADFTLLVEPNNAREHPNYLLTGMDLCREVVDRINSPNVQLLFDTYHIQIMDGDLVKSFEAHQSQIAHIQLGNNPGRHEPNRGEINHNYLFEIFAEKSYSGWIAGEYFPASDTRTGLAWLDDKQRQRNFSWTFR
ncbi:MAG: hydroxypyruvate isomerase family protein, partial [Methyloligellaceae bacterium]